MADTKNIQPVEEPNATDKENEDMTVANGKGKQCKFVAIQNYQDLYSSLLLASSTYKNKSSLEGLYKLTEKLYDSAVMAWDAMMESPDVALKSLGNTTPENVNVESLMAMECCACIPVCSVMNGSAEAIAIINDWKTKVRDIQSKLRVRINSLKLDAEKITETEQKTSNAFNNILFFITHDPAEHGRQLMECCKESPNVAELTTKIAKLQAMLDTFTDSDDNDANSVRFGTGSYYRKYNAVGGGTYRCANIPNLYKWKSVVGRCQEILKLRNSTNPEDKRRLQYA